VDGLSLETAADVAGPVSSPLVRSDADLARSLGWELTVDAFASEANSLLPRFFARYAEPLAEAEEAFEVNDWDRSACPSCRGVHHETLFAFPPAAFLNRFVVKARADGIRAVVVTPLAVSAQFWSKHLRASVVNNEESYLRPGQASGPATTSRSTRLGLCRGAGHLRGRLLRVAQPAQHPAPSPLRSGGRVPGPLSPWVPP
jgi:hypothetical protein